MRTRENSQNAILASLLLMTLVVIALLLPSSAQAQLDGTAPAPVTTIPPLQTNTVRNAFVSAQVIDNVVYVNIPGTACREAPTDLVGHIIEPVEIPEGVTGAVNKPLTPVFLCQGLNTYGVGFFLYERDSEYVFQINIYDDSDVLLNDDVLIVVRSRDTKLSLNPF